MSNNPVTSGSVPTSSAITDCWNRVGTRGDASCAELENHTHCRNCPTFTSAAGELLDRDLPADHLDEWTRHVAQIKTEGEGVTQSVVIFRIGEEWLGLPTSVFKEIVGSRPVHSLPHRRNGLLLGLVNIRGELLVCISLRHILCLEENAEIRKDKPRAANPRMLLIHQEGLRVVCPVDEVYGVHRFYPRELVLAPATLAKATTTYTKVALLWQHETVGLLDEQLLFCTVSRGLA